MGPRVRASRPEGNGGHLLTAQAPVNTYADAIRCDLARRDPFALGEAERERAAAAVKRWPLTALEGGTLEEADRGPRRRHSRLILRAPSAPFRCASSSRPSTPLASLSLLRLSARRRVDAERGVVRVRRKALLIWRGTGISNPSPSSGESVANRFLPRGSRTVSVVRVFETPVRVN
jgi:hypothetical protein